MINNKTNLLKSIFVAILLAATSVVHAIPFSTDLTISGSITYDSTNSYVTGTTQSGSISSTIGGTNTSSSISGVTLTGSNPLAGVMTDIGDGFGSSFTMSGDQNGDEGGLFSDYLFDITNNSATDQYQVTFGIEFSNLANADGTDAYADSQISIWDETNIVEVFFSDLTSDTLFGDEENGTILASFGASLSDSGLFNLDVLIDPLASFQLSGFNELEGGVYDSTSSFNGELTSFISVANVINLTQPVPAPEPGILLLMATGLLGILVRRRKF